LTTVGVGEVLVIGAAVIWGDIPELFILGLIVGIGGGVVLIPGVGNGPDAVDVFIFGIGTEVGVGGFTVAVGAGDVDGTVGVAEELMTLS
jgi:hypothetical protein